MNKNTTFVRVTKKEDRVNTKIKLYIQGLTNSQVQSGAYALILAEEDGLRRIPIIVGTSEAQSIAIVLERLSPPRPLTHDLFTSIFQAVGVRLLEVFIYKFEEGIFYSELVVEANGEQIRIDSRTSDAIAIALRVRGDIYTTESIIRECGVVMEEDAENVEQRNVVKDEDLRSLEIGDIKNEKQMSEWLALQSYEGLQIKLEASVAEENYEHAQLYKNELNRRKTKEDVS
jgi:Uncharacterized conserved protein